MFDDLCFVDLVIVDFVFCVSVGLFIVCVFFSLL